jgi:hypothetical protein
VFDRLLAKVQRVPDRVISHALQQTGNDLLFPNVQPRSEWLIFSTNFRRLHRHNEFGGKAGRLTRRGTAFPTAAPQRLEPAYAVIAEEKGLSRGFLERNPVHRRAGNKRGLNVRFTARRSKASPAERFASSILKLST